MKRGGRLEALSELPSKVSAVAGYLFQYHFRGEALLCLQPMESGLRRAEGEEGDCLAFSFEAPAEGNLESLALAFAGACASAKTCLVEDRPSATRVFLRLEGNSLSIGVSGQAGAGAAAGYGEAILAFLAAAAADPGRSLRELPLVGEDYRASVAAGARLSDDPESLGEDLYALVTRHCAASNGETAIIDDGKPISYASLLDRVEAIAARLAESGCEPGDFVGICLPRSADMIAAMLAVLRSGCAYVPLDPSFPRDRLANMAERAGIALVVTVPSLEPLTARPGVRAVDASAAGRAEAPPPVSSSPESPAYLIFTSGSTGRPKGVMVPRRALANFLKSMLRKPGIRASDKLCAVTTFSFDIAELELLGPLCVRATVVIAPESAARDPRDLSRLLASSGATILQATPITWSMLRESGWEGSPSLTALCGGEALPPELARWLAPRVARLWNMYGPTETTVWSTCARIEDAGSPITVGRPIDNTSVYVLDEGRRLLPPGAEGRLFIGGAGVALGYLGEEELTAARFVRDPFRPGDRMYDTGDLARIGADGDLYIRGRVDSQIKVRGFRVEPGEIEACLAAFPGIARSVVVPWNGGPAGPSLAAFYLLGAGAAEPSDGDLLRHCQAVLPPYMMPSRFIRLEAVPTTANGKVDRARLTRMVGEYAERAHGRLDAATATPLSEIARYFLLAASMSRQSAYTIASLVRIEGGVSPEGLESAWARIREASPILRSRVVESGGEYFFVEESGPRPALERMRADGRDPLDIARERAERPLSAFDYPLARLILIESGPRLHSLLLLQHHIVTDLHSKNVLAGMLSRAYSDPGWIPETIPYSVFARAEADFLGGEAGRRAREYWTEKLEACSEPLRLPCAAASPEPFAGQGSSIAWALPGALASRLEEAEARSEPPFMVLLAAYAALLYRLSGQERFLIGVPLTNRLAVGNGPLLGPCVNVLPVAVSMDGATTFAELYARIRRELLLNHRHQGYPFLRIASSFRGERDPRRPRLLQAGFTCEPLLELELEGLECLPTRVPRGGAQMDLFFTWWRRDGRWEGAWEYNTGSFDEAEVLGWQGHFETLLGACLEDEARPIGKIPLLDEAAADLACRGRSAAYPLDRSMAELLRESFAARAAETALSFGGAEVSYAEMDGLVEAVAAFLEARAGRGGRIAVLLDRGPEMLYALHGIVRSGNAYVPIGIEWPARRILDILADVRPSLVLGGEEYRSLVAPSGLAFYGAREAIAAAPPGGTSGRPPRPEDPMYILYTSGTTGKPKGAVLPHRGIANRLLWMQDQYSLGPSDCVLLKTPYTFDVSAWELFWPFLAGARLAILDEGLHLDPREVLGAVERESVTVMHFVPSMLDRFLGQEELDRAKSLRDVVCSGEALAPDLVRRFMDALPGTRLHNLYGPTEASIDVTSWECSRRDAERGAVPIGRPIANTSVYVVDRDGSICPPYVAGEIMIGGVALADGYWERDELTAEKFIANPFGPGRLYRTGDRGRYAAGWAIEFIERMDTQVKVRGIRVELEEIESRLLEIPGVAKAVVKKGTYPTGEECLIAYYQWAGEGGLDVEGARSALRLHMQEALIPNAFVRLDGFPVSENGKLDRKALPDRVGAGQEEPGPGASPRPREAGSEETAVARAWESVLGVADVPSNRNFFDAGGNSLSMLTLRGALEAEFGREFRVVDLFQAPTIAGMAALARGPGEGASADGPADVAGGDSASGARTAADRARMQRGALGRIRRGGTR